MCLQMKLSITTLDSTKLYTDVSYKHKSNRQFSAGSVYVKEGRRTVHDGYNSQLAAKIEAERLHYAHGNRETCDVGIGCP